VKHINSVPANWSCGTLFDWLFIFFAASFSWWGFRWRTTFFIQKH